MEEDKDSANDESSEDEFGGYTIKGAASMFKRNNLPQFEKKPKRVRMINSDSYFDNVTKNGPNELLKEEDRYDFFKKKVGKSHDHFKKLVEQVNE